MQETDFIRRASRWAGPRQDVLRLLAIPIVLALLGATLALAYSLTQSTLYEARSTVVVSPGTKFLDPQDADSFPRITTTVEEIALTQRVLQDTAARLRQSGFVVPSLDWLRDHLRLSVSGDTPVLSIAGVTGDPRLARLVSSAETEALTGAISAASANQPRGLTLTIFSKGEDRGKIQPKPLRNVLLGVNAGLLIGCLLAWYLVSRSRTRPEA